MWGARGPHSAIAQHFIQQNDSLGSLHRLQTSASKNAGWSRRFASGIGGAYACASSVWGFNCCQTIPSKTRDSQDVKSFLAHPWHVAWCSSTALRSRVSPRVCLGLASHKLIGYWMEGSQRKTKELEETVWAVQLFLDGAEMLFASFPEGLSLQQQYFYGKLLQCDPKWWAKQGQGCLLGKICTAVAWS